jgi:predicted DNA-binding transcriptional regulator AlpA
MTVSEIALEHGVSRQSVHSYRTRGSFPKPVEGEGSTRPRFRADEVAAWFAANPPRPGRRTDLATRDEGASVETIGIAVPPGVALEAAREFVQWLRAQLDEDERIARAVHGPHDKQWWTPEDVKTLLCNDQIWMTDAQFIAGQSPARVLRETDAKRRILDLYATAVEDRSTLRARMREVINTDPDEFSRLHQQETKLIETADCLTPVVRLIALPYAGQPGYREEWRP